MIGIALYEGISPLSRFIRWQTRSQFSHAALVNLQTHEVFEAWAGCGVAGWHALDLHHRPGTVVTLFSLWQPLCAEEETRLRVWLSLQRGKAYDYAGVLRFLSRRPQRDNSRSWFCSELIAAGFEHLCRPLLTRVPAYELAPGHLAWSPALSVFGRLVTSRTPTERVNGLRNDRSENRHPCAAGGLQAFCKGSACECTSICESTLAMGGAA